MLGAFTSKMCADPWGRLGFARAFIKCPKRVTQPVITTAEGTNDGFTTVLNQKKKGKAQVSAPNKMNEGVKMNKPKVKVIWQKVTQPGDKGDKEENNAVKLKNHLEELCDQDELVGNRDISETSGLNNDTKDVEPDPNSSNSENKPWILMGDFNVALNIADSYSGSSQMNSAMIEFKDCVSKIKVMDINSTGLHFTWNQKPKGGDGILKRLDRIMGNIEFIDSFLGAYAIFQPYRILNHSPSVVAEFWNKNVDGYTMFQVPRAELDEVQKALDLDPDNHILREEEADYVEAFNVPTLDEERFLKQKEKSSGWMLNKVSKMSYLVMVRDISDAEIKIAMFDIGDDRAPGPDGFTFAFFKIGWDVVGSDVCKAIR
nr:hypothetical protein [Tanacetum cinerariifolium]